MGGKILSHLTQEGSELRLHRFGTQEGADLIY